VNVTHPYQCNSSERRITPSADPSYELPSQAPAIGIRQEEEETSSINYKAMI